MLHQPRQVVAGGFAKLSTRSLCVPLYKVLCYLKLVVISVTRLEPRLEQTVATLWLESNDLDSYAPHLQPTNAYWQPIVVASTSTMRLASKWTETVDVGEDFDQTSQ